MKRPRRSRQAGESPLGPLYDYDEAAVLTGYSPGYLRKLCDLRRLSYVVQVYYRNHKRRLIRRIPHGALVALMAPRYRPALHRHHPAPPRQAPR